MTLVTDGNRTKVFLRNGRKYGGPTTQISHGFIRVHDDIDGKLHIIPVDEIAELIEEVKR